MKLSIPESWFKSVGDAQRWWLAHTEKHDADAQRNVWRNMALTNWVGDDGFIWKSRAEVRGFNQEGDVTWCKAKVIKKCIQKNRYCVDISCWCENQRHDVTIPGKATVILSSHENDPVIYPEPVQST